MLDPAPGTLHASFHLRRSVNRFRLVAYSLKRLAQVHRIQAGEKFLRLGGESALSSGPRRARMGRIGLWLVDANHDGNRMRRSAGELAHLRIENDEAEAAL